VLELLSLPFASASGTLKEIRFVFLFVTAEEEWPPLLASVSPQGDICFSRGHKPAVSMSPHA